MQYKSINKRLLERIDELESIKEENEFELSTLNITIQQQALEKSSHGTKPNKEDILQLLKLKLIEERNK